MLHFFHTKSQIFGDKNVVNIKCMLHILSSDNIIFSTWDKYFCMWKYHMRYKTNNNLLKILYVIICMSGNNISEAITGW